MYAVKIVWVGDEVFCFYFSFVIFFLSLSESLMNYINLSNFLYKFCVSNRFQIFFVGFLLKILINKWFGWENWLEKRLKLSFETRDYLLGFQSWEWLKIESNFYLNFLFFFSLEWLKWHQKNALPYNKYKKKTSCVTT